MHLNNADLGQDVKICWKGARVMASDSALLAVLGDGNVAYIFLL